MCKAQARRSLLLAAVACIFTAAAPSATHAQLVRSDANARPSFEVATVKPNLSGDTHMNFEFTTVRFRAVNATVEQLIRFAYNLRTGDGMEGGPKWTSSKRFDVEAKIADSDAERAEKLQPMQRFEEYRLMMQSLLAERFRLETTIEMMEQPVYALVVAKNGPKLAAVEPGKQHMPWLTGGSRGQLDAKSVSMAFFCDWLSGQADTGGRMVVDKTGLMGSYDFGLSWTPIDGAASAPGQPKSLQGGALFTELQEELGLKLVPEKAPVEVLVIDHVEEPSQN